MKTQPVGLIEVEPGERWVLTCLRGPKDMSVLHINGREELQEIWLELRRLQSTVARLNVNKDTPHLDSKEATA